MHEMLAPYATMPIAEHVRYHFGYADGTAARRGKRLRPRLTFAAAREEGGRFEDASGPAVAIEILHNYSLVHDDIEDGDRLRHGVETVWARYGIAHGINAGDAMCGLAYLSILRNESGAPGERVASLARVLHEANLAMCSGQGLDIGFESAAHVAMDEYIAMIGGKTAALFGAACQLGAIAAGSGAQRAEAYAELGRAYGLAFQIRDDVLGSWGAPDQTGKPSGADIARRKWTFPVVWALSGPPSAARERIAHRYAKAGPIAAADVALVVAALDELHARRAADDACDAYLRDANTIAKSHGIDPSGTVRTLFTESARRVA